MIQGQEADDAIAQMQWAHKDKSTCAVTIDKDILYGVPGYNFNWVKGELGYTSLPAANAFLFRQMLQGDSSDNIPGINKVGPKTIDKLFAGKEENIDALREIVKSMYRNQYGRTWEQAYYEVGNLLWIRRELGVECPLL